MNNFLSKFNFSQYSDKDKNKWYPNTERDWAVIFVCAVVSVLSILFFHFYLYLDMRTEGFFSRPSSLQENAVGVINKKGLFFVLAEFDAKKARFDKLFTESISITDPSTGVMSTSGTVPATLSGATVNTLLSQ